MNENWKPIRGYEGLYEVSDQGRVRSVARTVRVRTRRAETTREHPGCILRPLAHTGGYARYMLWKGGVAWQSYGHRFVLEAFVGPRPPGMQACHNNGVRTDNRLENLRWDTPSANQADRERHGTSRSGRTFAVVVKTPQMVERIRELSRSLNITQVAREVGLPRTSVADVINGRTHRV